MTLRVRRRFVVELVGLAPTREFGHQNLAERPGSCATSRDRQRGSMRPSPFAVHSAHVGGGVRARVCQSPTDRESRAAANPGLPLLRRGRR
jgi:hypothetical protein